ncbi:MAG: YihY/virulence factor BrkB family protein [Acidimicrobiales bacterium]|nr:YihY/virulence factor BrkB family protein [Acidimicrobiales bacterium]
MSRHHTMLLASGVAFTSALGLVPTMVVVVAVYGLVAEPSDVEAHVSQLAGALPVNARALIVSELQSVTAIGNAKISIGLALGLLGAAYAVSSVVNSIVIAIRVAHDMDSPHSWLTGRLFALRLSALSVLATAALIWLVVVLPPVLEAWSAGESLHTALSVMRWPVAVIISCVAIALLYRSVVGSLDGVLVISHGAMAGTIMWVLSTYGLTLAYDNIDRMDSTFTSLGAVAALLVWLYLSALSVLVGAEIDALSGEIEGKDT